MSASAMRPRSLGRAARAHLAASLRGSAGTSEAALLGRKGCAPQGCAPQGCAPEGAVLEGRALGRGRGSPGSSDEAQPQGPSPASSPSSASPASPSSPGFSGPASPGSSSPLEARATAAGGPRDACEPPPHALDRVVPCSARALERGVSSWGVALWQQESGGFPARGSWVGARGTPTGIAQCRAPGTAAGIGHCNTPGTPLSGMPWGAWTQVRGFSKKKGKGSQPKGKQPRHQQEEEDSEEAEEEEEEERGTHRGAPKKGGAKAGAGKPGKKGGAGGDSVDRALTESTGGGVSSAEDAAAVLSDMGQRMQEAAQGFRKELGKLRTGRASIDMLDHVTMEAYGQRVPLSHSATVTVRDPQLLAVTLHDASLSSSAMKGLSESPMGLTPTLDGAGGGAILVPVPRLTGETRQAMMKLANQACEAAKVTLRRIRKEGMSALKSGDLPEDERKRLEKKVEALTAEVTKELDSLKASKEKELSI